MKSYLRNLRITLTTLFNCVITPSITVTIPPMNVHTSIAHGINVMAANNCNTLFFMYIFLTLHPSKLYTAPKLINVNSTSTVEIYKGFSVDC